MSSSSQISGLISNLDTAEIITSLMAVEALPQTQLSDKKSDLTSLVTALQSLNTKVASLGDNATTAAKASSWNAYAATSSSTSVTATADSTATASSLSFTVDKLATSQISVSGTLSTASDFTGGASSITLKVGDTLTQVDTSSATSVADLAAAINKSGAGVSASAVKYTDTSGTTAYRLQLTGQTSGAANTVSVYQGTEAEVTAGTATAVSLTTTRTAQDAQLTLWPGTSQAQAITSSSNTFSDLLTGVDITVTEEATDPVTVTVGQDTEAVAKLGSNLVEQLNQVLSEISTRTASTTTTNSDGTTSVTGGVLSGNSLVRNLSQQLAEAGSYDVDGVSPSTIGITIDSEGTFSFDEETFTAALASDPEGTQALLTAISTRVADVATTASDEYDGTLTAQVTSDNAQIEDLADKIADWDSILASRKEALEAQWATLETSLQTLNSTASWLTTAIASLSSSSS
ncbi:MAG: flagellar filament capping protein FliD [Actinobacteria bacterium]|nr:flagellar filament capping protein FliD [Actinomycetota bacterium]MCG2798524.1 flagellar filament capping protein FliD [Cellulomonas sp.]